ncbi:MAG: thiamine phosphate synthase [Gammaproteobacteria bacterium]|nr:thiamine phosphate synthase [Gammaproteobacteria bacterium]
MSRLARGLYAITDSRLIGERLVESVEAAIIGGAVVVQYRDKSADHTRRLKEATTLQQLCRDHNVTFIVNDDLELAAQIGADGLHIGQEDNSLNEARQQLGTETIIGVSCYNRFELAQEAEDAGADYVAFGRFFSSNIKPDAVGAHLELLERAKNEITVPVVAIGGITAENGAQLVEAGADLLAVISDLFDRPTATEITAAAQRLQTLFN